MSERDLPSWAVQSPWQFVVHRLAIAAVAILILDAHRFIEGPYLVAAAPVAAFLVETVWRIGVWQMLANLSRHAPKAEERNAT